MTQLRKRSRMAFAGLLAVAALGSAAPAQAQTEGGTPGDCDVRLERLVDQFYDMADRRSYEDAADWWQARWHAYHTSCVIH